VNATWLPSFTDVWNLGYRDLVPVEPRDKAVLLKGWQYHVTTEADLDRWQRQGKSIGIRTGKSLAGDTILVGVDADTMDEALATDIYSTLTEVTGYSEMQLISRVGNWPRQMYLFQKQGGLGAIGGKISFGGGNGAKPDEVEVRTAGLQFVAFGIHPITQRPYRWPNGFPPAADLPLIGQDQIDQFMELMRERMPKARGRTGAGKPAADQGSLKGEAARLQVAMAFIENTRTTRLPNGAELDYHGWVQMAYALKAALGDAGWPLFEAFSAAWKDGAHDPRITASTWKGAKGPFRVGAPWIFEAAEINSNGLFRKDGNATPPPPQDGDPGWTEDDVHDGHPDDPGAQGAPPPPIDIELIVAASLSSTPTPCRSFLDSASLIPLRNVSMLSGDGGVGKSLLALQLGVAVATSTEWLGMEIKGGVAIYVSAEDDLDELHVRLADIVSAENLLLADLTRLKIVPLAGKDAVLAAEDRKSGRLVPTQLLAQLAKAVEGEKPILLVIDNLADVFAGNENIRPFAKHFVGMLRGLAIATGCAVLLLGHPSLSGLSSGSGLSGSTGWNNSVRSRLYLTARRDQNGDAEGEEANPDQRWLRSMKANYAPLAEPLSLRWQDGRFIRAEPEKAFDGITTAHLETVRSAFRNGAWRYDERSPDWGGIEVARIIDTDIGAGLVDRDMTAAQKAARRKVRMLLSTWTRTNQIRVVERADKQRKPKRFYEAV
jgi:hypothetical protein